MADSEAATERDEEDALIGLIYEGTIEPDPWSSFVHALRLRMNATGTLLMFNLPSPRQETLDVSDAEWPGHTMRGLHYEKYSQFNPLEYDRMEVGRLYSFDDFVDPETFRQSVYYREFCAPQGIEHPLITYLGEAKGLRAWLGVSRNAAQGPYRREDVRRFERLLPHLCRALHIYATLLQSRAATSAYRHTVDHLNLATLLLNERGSVSEMNESARTLVERAAEVSVRSGRVEFPRRADQQQYRALLQNLMAQADGVGYASFMAGAETGPRLSVLMRRVRQAQQDPSGAMPAVILYLREQGRDAPVKTEVVSSLFGLTATEARLAVMLAGGMSLRDIAEALGLTEQTARTYCKRIFAKTDTARQADLVRLILTSLAGLIGT
jgi:DNA-binding CsgD family transcriptional regulator/PAS domain-containing protein